MAILQYHGGPSLLSVAVQWPGTTLLVLGVTYYMGWIVYTRFFHPLAKIPGPFLASISRFWYVREVMNGGFDKEARELHEKYGPVVRVCPDEVIVSDPQALKTIYGINSGFIKSDFYPEMGGKKRLSKYVDHFSQTDEKLHAQRRRLVNGIYSLSSILESEQYVDSCSNLFMSKMDEFARDGANVDLGKWLQFYAFDVIGELYFGQKFGFMERNEDIGGYIASLDRLFPFQLFAATIPSYLRPIYLSLGFMLLPYVRNAINGQIDLTNVARSRVRQRLEKMTREEGGEMRRDMLAKFLDVHREKGEKEDFQISEVTAECMVGIAAGSDTTAIALRAILYYLVRTPRAYAKLTAEIDEADKNGTFCTPNVKYSEAIKLPYLVACCKEGMRMHPSVGLSLPRVVPKSGCNISGFYIPEGWNAGISATVIQFDKSIFGPDADQFNPDRWLNGDSTNMDRYMFQFGAGSRTCIGKNVSLSEIHKMIPQFVRNYKIELVHPDQEWQTAAHWFTKQTGFDVRITKR